MRKIFAVLVLVSFAPLFAEKYNTAQVRAWVRSVESTGQNECFLSVETDDDLLWAAIPDYPADCDAVAVNSCIEMSGKVAEITLPPGHDTDHINISAALWAVVDSSLCD